MSCSCFALLQPLDTPQFLDVAEILWPPGQGFHGDQILDARDATRDAAQIGIDRAFPQIVEVDRIADEHIDRAERIVRMPDLENEHVAVLGPVIPYAGVSEVCQWHGYARLEATVTEHLHGPLCIGGLEVDQKVQILGESQEAVQVDREAARYHVSHLRNLQRGKDAFVAGYRHRRMTYMFRRYSPPTSYNAWLIWPSEWVLTASISASNTLRRSRAVSWR